MFQLLWPYRAIILSVCMLGLTLSGCGGGGDAQELSEGEVLRVSCDAGETIGDALYQAQANDTIVIGGMCQEPVVVTKDGITLDGGGSAVIDGTNGSFAVVLVKGRQNVTIKGLTLQNGLIGLYMDGGAAVELESITAQNNLRASNRSNGNDGSGVVVSGGSTARFRGGRISGNQGRAGLTVTSGSTVVATGLTVENNALQGIGVYRNMALAGKASVCTSTPRPAAVRRMSDRGGTCVA